VSGSGRAQYRPGSTEPGHTDHGRQDRMTIITGREPKHWHDKDGRHRMPDPRQFKELHRRNWSPDEKRYADHLTEHEQAQDCPDRLPGDPEVIVSLFDLIDSRFAEVRKMRLLILALRQKFAAAPEGDDRDDKE
jgi:hypothetical protein